MTLRPTTLRKANEFVANYHRHSKPVARNGGRFAISLWVEDLIGVIIVGNPIARALMDGETAEVLRCCVKDSAPANACSKLYGAAWKAWKAMGGKKMITYTLQKESGSSLKGAGWKKVGVTKPHQWTTKTRPRKVQEIYNEPKYRWEVTA